MRQELESRERELYRVLRDWPDVPAVAIGGYAASAWSFPRFSHDLDFLVEERHADRLRAHFREYGLRIDRTRTEIEQNYGGGWEQWVGGDRNVTIDLLVNSVQDRDFQVPLPFREVWRDHAVRPIRGLVASGIQLPVASKESLLALKCQPMRRKDIGDICSLAYVGFDPQRLRRLLDPVLETRSELLVERLGRFVAALGTTPEQMQHALGPRIPGFARLRQDMASTVARYTASMQQWIREAM